MFSIGRLASSILHVRLRRRSDKIRRPAIAPKPDVRYCRIEVPLSTQSSLHHLIPPRKPECPECLAVLPLACSFRGFSVRDKAVARCILSSTTLVTSEVALRPESSRSLKSDQNPMSAEDLRLLLLLGIVAINLSAEQVKLVFENLRLALSLTFLRRGNRQVGCSEA